MKKIQRIALGLALLAALGAGASAKSSGSKPRPLSGTVQNIDLRSRTMTVRERETGNTVTVQVPNGALVRTSSTNQPLMQLERLIPGMSVSAVVE